MLLIRKLFLISDDYGKLLVGRNSKETSFYRCILRIQADFSMNGYLVPFAVVVGLCFIVMIIFMVRLVRVLLLISYLWCGWFLSSFVVEYFLI